MNILIIRNDKLGDFILTLPCYKLLKATLPDIHISVLVPEYTSSIAQCSHCIDNVIIDRDDKSIAQLLSMTNELRTHRFDAVITLFSTTRIGLAVQLAGIRYRLAPATKLAQIFYNHRLTQKRSRSEKPEYEYNLDLIKKYLSDIGVDNIPKLKPPYLALDKNDISDLHSQFCQQHGIDQNKKLIFLHAGSGGSANNLGLDQYARLASKLETGSQFVFVLTAGPGEIDRVRELSALMSGTEHIIYHSTKGLITFTKHIAFADLFISGSTGTLHIAGALDVPTAAFYTRRRSATSLRWQTLNSPEKRLAFSPPEDAEVEDMSKVDVIAAAAAINEKFLRD